MLCYLKDMEFDLETTEGFARKGSLSFSRGQVQTPVFMPVGTNGTVKGLEIENILATNSEIILGNTFHLMLRPGDQIIKQLGGLHSFINWPKPILTDSGGFQVWSLGDLAEISEDGVNFKSPYDGAHINLTPELSIQIQENLGSDVVMVFDDCTKYPATHNEAKTSMDLSMRWAQRSKDAHKSKSALFGIIQGGMFEDLRLESLNKLTDIGFDGIAIGGLSVGEPQAERIKILQSLAPALPEDIPRYLMGVGKPEDIVESIYFGIDMFDCVLPTRNARNGQLITSFGEINIRNASNKDSELPIDPDCGCKVCKQYSRSYLHHLDKTKEMLGSILSSFHNIYYYQQLMLDIRNAIKEKSFANFVKEFYNKRQKSVPSYLS